MTAASRSLRSASSTVEAREASAVLVMLGDQILIEEEITKDVDCVAYVEVCRR